MHMQKIDSFEASPKERTGRRIVALDGFRGLMTLFVILSHYFGEIAGGILPLRFGFIAVDSFFVLSGLLVGRLILDKGDAENFYQVFYARRILRTFPIYFLCVALAIAVERAIGLPGNDAVPTWSYFSFTNNIFVALTQNTGREWLGPTWTMGVEEQFYLIAPALMLATPRRYLLHVLTGIIALSIASRFAIFLTSGNSLAALTLLPTRADNLAIGLACALLLKTGIRWDSFALRAAPIFLLILFFVVDQFVGDNFPLLLGHTLVCVAAALFLMSMVRGAPEAKRFESKTLAFFGETSYAVYLTHMPILWVAHALILHHAPSIATGAGFAVTIACLPLTVLIATALTRFVEAPITSIGQRLKWRQAPPKAAALKTAPVEAAAIAAVCLEPEASR